MENKQTKIGGPSSYRAGLAHRWNGHAAAPQASSRPSRALGQTREQLRTGFLTTPEELLEAKMLYLGWMTFGEAKLVSQTSAAKLLRGLLTPDGYRRGSR